MSLVTTIILIAPFEPEGIRQLDEWSRSFDLDSYYGLSEDIALKNEKTGGGKYPESGVYAAGWNYFPDHDGLVAKFKSIAWRRPEDVVLIIRRQDGPTMVVRPDTHPVDDGRRFKSFFARILGSRLSARFGRNDGSAPHRGTK